MQRGSFRGWALAKSALVASMLGLSILVAQDAFARQRPTTSRPPHTAQELKHESHVRREMRAAMHRERLRHRARMHELAQRDRATRRTKDLDEKQRVHDLQMAERLLFAQRMRDLRMKAPADR